MILSNTNRSWKLWNSSYRNEQRMSIIPSYRYTVITPWFLTGSLWVPVNHKPVVLFAQKRWFQALDGSRRGRGGGESQNHPQQILQRILQGLGILLVNLHFPEIRRLYELYVAAGCQNQGQLLSLKCEHGAPRPHRYTLH